MGALRRGVEDLKFCDEGVRVTIRRSPWQNGYAERLIGSIRLGMS
jgi:hypothetical protein